MKQKLVELKGEIDKSSYSWGLQMSHSHQLIEVQEKIKNIELHTIE